MLGIVNSTREWLSLLAGDGVVNFVHKTLGFSAKYAEVAEAALRLLAVWAGAYGAGIRVKEREHKAEYASSKDAARVLNALLTGEVLERAMTLARSWSGLAGSDAPKVISLLALAQLLGVVEGKWAVELWLAHKAATTPTPPEVAKALESLFAKVEGMDKVEWEERGVNVYFKVRSLEDVSRTITLRLYTDFANFRLYCGSCNEVSARRILETVAEWLRPAVERLRLVAEEWPRWEGNALDLPAEVGWATFLRLWRRHNMSLRVEEGGKELLRVEVLEARVDGTAKFSLWYYKWRETRPHQPYVDVEIKPYYFKDGRIGFKDRVYANEAEGIYKEHLAEIAELLKRIGVEGIAYYDQGRKGALLQFTGVFRDSVLGRLGISPQLPRAEPVAVRHLGGYKFRVGDREVEFGVKAMGPYEFYAELKFPSRDEAERFASSLSTISIDAKIAGNTVRLDSDSFFGLLATTGTVPPGLTLLYRPEEDDFRVYASVEEGRMRFYFAVKHGGVWKVAEGLYNEEARNVVFRRAEQDVLDAIRDAVAKALKRLGRPTDIGEPRAMRDKEDRVETYYLSLHSPHLVPFLEHAAERVKAEPADVLIEGRRVAVKTGGVETTVVFRLLKRSEAVFLMAQDVDQTLVLYKSLRALGVPMEVTPKGVKVDGEAMWALMATAVEKAVERGALRGLPMEVMPGVELLNVYNVGGMKM